MGEQTERGRGGGPEDEVGAQVLPKRLEVVLRDRLVDAEHRENHVSRAPDGGAEISATTTPASMCTLIVSNVQESGVDEVLTSRQ